MALKLTYANMVATLALIVAVGGASAFAATQLAKNSVGSKQLKKNAVVTAKVKNGAITGAKVKKGTLTGTQINVSTLGTVPSANSAQTAQTANALSATEPWHEVGAPGEPAFQHSWENEAARTSESTVAFYKDHEGIVHLRGFATGGDGETIFQLPAGFRPPNGKVLNFSVVCSGPGGCETGTGPLAVFGSAFGNSDGAVAPSPLTKTVFLEGVSFRAES
jgi:hypothetical protein